MVILRSGHIAGHNTSTILIPKDIASLGGLVKSGGAAEMASHHGKLKLCMPERHILVWLNVCEKRMNAGPSRFGG